MRFLTCCVACLGGAALAADDLSRLKPAPATPITESQLSEGAQRGVDYLLKTQNKDGSWGSPRWAGGVDGDPLTAQHSFEVATTALCVEALLEIGGDSPEVRKSLDQGEAYLLRELSSLKRADSGNVPNIWGHGYGIQTLAALHRRTQDSGKRATYEKLIAEQTRKLEHFESVNGGWFYYASGFQKPNNPSCSFVNAAILINLKHGEEVGVKPPERVVARALHQLKAMRCPDGSFVYTKTVPTSGSPQASINRPPGSLGRSQAGNAALRIFGDPAITDEVIKVWLDRLVTRQGWLDMGRKRPIPHESHAAVAGYFYYFGHYYAARCISLLPPADRPFYQDHLATILLQRQEQDGCWWDYPLYSYGKPYGTAFSLLSLARCRKAPG